VQGRHLKSLVCLEHRLGQRRSLHLRLPVLVLPPFCFVCGLVREVFVMIVPRVMYRVGSVGLVNGCGPLGAVYCEFDMFFFLSLMSVQ